MTSRIDQSGPATISFNGSFQDWAKVLYLRAEGDEHLAEYRRRLNTHSAGKELSDDYLRSVLYKSWVNNGFDKTESAVMFNIKNNQ